MLTMNPKLLLLAVGGAALAPVHAAHATETITYTYDVHGRVVGVVHSGTVNNGVNVSYSYDAADNRTAVVTSGSAN
ncbi:hypothetical protein [Novosphingobium sp. JCM 18896]|uniref:hypothetical protein n=1 Tax=Novosphingobium sp. JCM 18896 TaxID=2989731 RepID=UPI002221E3CD|nr:hypothetical protein [Novosphingobium sp. JCM 18896]MCW1432414.1 hypothetical protein [Novosphingobium sp. JCM 18896]